MMETSKAWVNAGLRIHELSAMGERTLSLMSILRYNIIYSYYLLISSPLSPSSLQKGTCMVFVTSSLHLEFVVR